MAFEGLTYRIHSGDLIQGKEVRQDGRMPPWRRGSVGGPTPLTDICWDVDA